ncbi:MAG: hypothetical protein K6E56_07435, partial [Lachnospiraceae bacterium]|nr:hypothetical protein [Lachnospiraceae bacterium]
MTEQNRKRTVLLFIVSFVIIFVVFISSVIKTGVYNRKEHHITATGDALFCESPDKSMPVSINAVPRSSTWTKVFDLDDEGLTEHNFQAFTYDFTVMNYTGDEVRDFTFVLTFSTDVYLSSAWNGSLEIHQKDGESEITATVPDLREFNPNDYPLKT